MRGADLSMRSIARQYQDLGLLGSNCFQTAAQCVLRSHWQPRMDHSFLILPIVSRSFSMILKSL